MNTPRILSCSSSSSIKGLDEDDETVIGIERLLLSEDEKDEKKALHISEEKELVNQRTQNESNSDITKSRTILKATENSQFNVTQSLHKQADSDNLKGDGYKVLLDELDYFGNPTLKSDEGKTLITKLLSYSQDAYNSKGLATLSNYLHPDSASSRIKQDMDNGRHLFSQMVCKAIDTYNFIQQHPDELNVSTFDELAKYVWDRILQNHGNILHDFDDAPGVIKVMRSFNGKRSATFVTALAENILNLIDGKLTVKKGFKYVMVYNSRTGKKCLINSTSSENMNATTRFGIQTTDNLPEHTMFMNLSVLYNLVPTLLCTNITIESHLRDLSVLDKKDVNNNVPIMTSVEYVLTEVLNPIVEQFSLQVNSLRRAILCDVDVKAQYEERKQLRIRRPNFKQTVGLHMNMMMSIDIAATASPSILYDSIVRAMWGHKSTWGHGFAPPPLLVYIKGRLLSECGSEPLKGTDIFDVSIRYKLSGGSAASATGDTSFAERMTDAAKTNNTEQAPPQTVQQSAAVPAPQGNIAYETKDVSMSDTAKQLATAAQSASTSFGNSVMSIADANIPGLISQGISYLAPGLTAVAGSIGDTLYDWAKSAVGWIGDKLGICKQEVSTKEFLIMLMTWYNAFDGMVLAKNPAEVIFSNPNDILQYMSTLSPFGTYQNGPVSSNIDQIFGLSWYEFYTMTLGDNTNGIFITAGLPRMNVSTIAPPSQSAARYIFGAITASMAGLMVDKNPNPIMMQLRPNVDFFNFAVVANLLKQLSLAPNNINAGFSQHLLKLILMSQQQTMVVTDDLTHNIEDLFLDPPLANVINCIAQTGSFWTFSSNNTNVPPVINVFAVDSNTFARILNGAVPPPNVLVAPGTFDSTTAVVPISLELAGNKPEAVPWLLSFLQYPFTILSHNLEVRNSAGTLANNSRSAVFTNPNTTYVPGPIQNILIVVVDINANTNAPTQNVVISNNGTVAIIPLWNPATPPPAPVDVGPVFLSYYQDPNLGKLAGEAMLHWTRMFGSVDDVKEAYYAAVTLLYRTREPKLVAFVSNTRALGNAISDVTVVCSAAVASNPNIIAEPANANLFIEQSDVYYTTNSISGRTASAQHILPTTNYTTDPGPTPISTIGLSNAGGVLAVCAAVCVITPVQGIPVIVSDPGQIFRAIVQLGRTLAVVTDNFIEEHGLTIGTTSSTWTNNPNYYKNQVAAFGEMMNHIAHVFFGFNGVLNYTANISGLYNAYGNRHTDITALAIPHWALETTSACRLPMLLRRLAVGQPYAPTSTISLTDYEPKMTQIGDNSAGPPLIYLTTVYNKGITSPMLARDVMRASDWLRNGSASVVLLSAKYQQVSEPTVLKSYCAISVHFGHNNRIVANAIIGNTPDTLIGSFGLVNVIYGQIPWFSNGNHVYAAYPSLEANLYTLFKVVLTHYERSVLTTGLMTKTIQVGHAAGVLPVNTFIVETEAGYWVDAAQDFMHRMKP